jgi:hypothetical protein
VTPRPRYTVAAIVVCVVGIRPASAQPARDPGRLEVSAGGVWVGSIDFGSSTASETTPTQTTRPLFTTTTTFGAAPAAEVRIGWSLSRALTAEAEGSYARPELRIASSADAENAAPVSAAVAVQQFTVGAALVWRMPLRSARATPFVTGGAGYLRQLHEGGTLAQTGRYYQFGGGLMVPLSSHSAARLKAIGLRIDARALIRVNGVAIDDAAHLAPAAGASLFLRF